MTPEWRQKACAEALLWVDTPYHHEAAVRGLLGGVDCAMLPLCVYSTTGLIPFLDPRPYPADWHLHQVGERYREHVEQWATRIEGPPLPADFVLLRYGSVTKRPHNHGAIVIDWPRVVHAVRMEKKVVCNVLDVDTLSLHDPLFYTLSARASA